jgi:NTP pyrophosphatase (non-canonical NTP hydrolase)
VVLGATGDLAAQVDAVTGLSGERRIVTRRAFALPFDPTAALRDVIAERQRQDAKWGEQNHDPFLYLSVLMEEVGEFAQAALHTRYGGEAASKLRPEAVQTAAVALAIVECLDRAKWEWGNHAEAARRYPDPPAAVLPEQTHARDPQVYPVSGVTRRVVGHVVPGPAPKREKRYVCEECGSDGEGGAVEYASGVVCHFRKIPKDGKIHSVMCSGLFEEEVRDEA